MKSIDAMSQTIQANGGIVVLPRQAIGQNMGWISAFKAPENNTIDLHEAPAPPPKKRSPRKVAKKATKKKRR